MKTSWVQNDLRLLSRHFQITDKFIQSMRNCISALNPYVILKHQVIIFWFASLSFFPIFLMSVMLRKKIIIIAGGYDVAKVPDIQYGAFTEKGLKLLLRKFMFKASDKIVSISHSNQKEALDNAKVPTSKSIMIYHGFKENKIPLLPFANRKKQILTIGVLNDITYQRKGYIHFLELAKKMPDWQFVHIGKVSPKFSYLQEFRSRSNLSLCGFLPDTEFYKVINESKFYLQLSMHEGFGCSIVDAALMGCFPIVFDRYAMPEVVAGCGEVIEFPKVESVEKAIMNFENSDIDVEKIRSHYLEKFSESKRENKLVQLISLVNKSIN